MGIIGWIIIGGIAGWLASLVMNRDKEQGIIGNIIVGIIGGIIGGFIMSLIGGEDINGFNLYSLLVAFLGAVLVLWIYSVIRGKK